MNESRLNNIKQLVFTGYLDKDITVYGTIMTLRVFCNDSERKTLNKYYACTSRQRTVILLNTLSSAIIEINFTKINKKQLKLSLYKIDHFVLLKIFALYYELVIYTNKLISDIVEFCDNNESKFLWNVCKGTNCIINDTNITGNDIKFPLNIIQKSWINYNVSNDEFEGKKIVIEHQWKMAEFLFENLGMLINPNAMRSYLNRKDTLSVEHESSKVNTLLEDMGSMMSEDDIENFVIDLRSNQDLSSPLFSGYTRNNDEPVEDFIERVVDDVYEKLMLYKKNENIHAKTMRETYKQWFINIVEKRLKQLKEKGQPIKKSDNESSLVVDYEMEESIGDADNKFDPTDPVYYQDILNEKFYTILGRERFELFENIVGSKIDDIETETENDDLKPVENISDVDDAIAKNSESMRKNLTVRQSGSQQERVKNILDRRDEMLRIANSESSEDFEERKSKFLKLVQEGQIKGDEDE